MPKVTSVEPQIKNPRRFNIFLDGQFAFGADEDTVVKFRLVPQKEILKEDLEKIIFETEVGKLMEGMYRLFNIRQRSEKEVRDYFKIKNFQRKIKDKEQRPQIVVDAVIEHLKQKNLINDLEFAKSWVESRRKNKQKGTNALKSELFTKGIDKEIIEQVLIEDVDEENLATTALNKKLKAWKNLSEQDFKKKATEFLIRKGFNYSDIKKVIENFLKKD